MNHTRFPKEDHLPYWTRRDNKVTKGDRVEGIALLFHHRGTIRGWVVSSTPRPQFTPGKGQVPIVQEAGWAPGSVWTGGKSRPHRDSIPDRPARSQSLYRVSYPAHKVIFISIINVHESIRKMWQYAFEIYTDADYCFLECDATYEGEPKSNVNYACAPHS